VIIKILEHRISHTEPSILLDNNIIINAPHFSKNISADNVILSHSHKENQRGLKRIVSKNMRVFFSKEHEWFFKFHSPSVYNECNHTYLTSKKEIRIGKRKITPIPLQHQVQKAYGKLCFGFLIDNRVMISTPCGKVSRDSLKFFNNLDVLIIDGGYKQDILYPDHMSISDIIEKFKGMKIKQIYFLGTHRDYKIDGVIKGTNTKIDTLTTGDIVKIK